MDDDFRVACEAMMNQYVPKNDYEDTNEDDISNDSTHSHDIASNESNEFNVLNELNIKKMVKEYNEKFAVYDKWIIDNNCECIGLKNIIKLALKHVNKLENICSDNSLNDYDIRDIKHIIASINEADKKFEAIKGIPNISTVNRHYDYTDAEGTERIQCIDVVTHDGYFLIKIINSKRFTVDKCINVKQKYLECIDYTINWHMKPVVVFKFGYDLDPKQIEEFKNNNLCLWLYNESFDFEKN